MSLTDCEACRRLFEARLRLHQPTAPSDNLTYDGSFTYRYDAENRLISASGSGLTASYSYDAQGRRKSKTVNGTTTIFVTDAQQQGDPSPANVAVVQAD